MAGSTWDLSCEFLSPRTFAKGPSTQYLGPFRGYMGVYEPLSKLLVSPLIAPIVVHYIILYITPLKEFRLKLI